MGEFFNSISPVISGLIGGGFVWWMISQSKAKAPVREGIKVLTYSTPIKIFTGLLIPFTFLILYVVSQSYEGQEIYALLISIGFILASIIFPYQVFLVRFSYDSDNIYLWSLCKGRKSSSWDKVAVIDYSKILQTEYMVVDGLGRIWFSNMMNGHEELGDFLSEKFPED